MKHIQAKPCPFCGWPVVEGKIDKRNGKTVYRIQCKSCKCGTDQFTYWGAAVNAWNRRVGEDHEATGSSMSGLSTQDSILP